MGRTESGWEKGGKEVVRMRPSASLEMQQRCSPLSPRSLDGSLIGSSDRGKSSSEGRWPRARPSGELSAQIRKQGRESTIPFALPRPGGLRWRLDSACELRTNCESLDLATLEVSPGRFSWLPIWIITSSRRRECTCCFLRLDACPSPTMWERRFLVPCEPEPGLRSCGLVLGGRLAEIDSGSRMVP